MTITAMNYAAQAERGFRELAPMAVNRQTESILCSMADGIKNAVHFSLPDGGKIFDDYLKGIRGIEIHIPFKEITIEFFSKDPLSESNYRKVLIIAQEDEDSINVMGCVSSKASNGDWYLVPYGISIPILWDSDMGTTDDGEVGFKCTPFTPFLDDFQKITKDEESEHCKQAIVFVPYVMELIEALSCINVRTEIRSPVDKSKNARRIKDGKLPIYETRILTVDTSAHHNEKLGMTVTDRASVRQHLRRGHIRRHPTAGNIWVQSCVVGYSELGVINKSYEVH
jgi:hypothetical protein